MTMQETDSTVPPSASAQSSPAGVKPLRAWPVLLLVGLMMFARALPNRLEGGMSSYWWIGLAGPLVACLLLIVWWLAASRATARERIVGLLGLLGAGALSQVLAHPSMRGPGTLYLTVPMGFAAFGLAAVIMSQTLQPLRRTGIILLCSCAGFLASTLLRNEGMDGNYALGLRWRWAESAETSMLAARKASSPGQTAATNRAGGDLQAGLLRPDWPGFRGADRSGRAAAATSATSATNWSTHPPRQLWKISVGPAWSSFAVASHGLFTQEQRGAEETVVCYDADTGREVWKQVTVARFDDPMGGPGPRATPTLADGGLYVTGAAGALLRLNPLDGTVVWQQDLKQLSGRQNPMWGFCASPLVAGSNVIVYAGGADNKGLLALDAGTGALHWSVAAGRESYGSPQLNSVAGENLVLMLTEEGLLGVRPETGETRLQHAWKINGYRALQPLVQPNDVILLPTGMTEGTRAIRVSKAGAGLSAETLWTAKGLKPDFTDLVATGGYVYGIDGGLLVCLDLKDGQRKWKEGRYGKGQTLLLEPAGLLLIAAEDGRVVLVAADPARHHEIASFQALEGKTWNHPVLIGKRLYVRNAQEAACYELGTN